MSNSGGCSGELSRLCRLVCNSLHHLNDVEPIPMTQDKERQLLIALSNVFNLIRSWTTQSDSENQLSDCCCHLRSEHHQCLTSIVANLMCFLNVKNQYIQHLVGNIFLAISEFLTAYDSYWNDFIHLLCNCLELAFYNAFAPSMQPSMSPADSLRFSLLNSSFSKSRLGNSSWNCMVAICGILRGIMKFLKGECHEELVGVFLNSLSNCTLRVPLDLLNGAGNGRNEGCVTSPADDGMALTNTDEAEVNVLFLGHLIQLLCSTLGLIGSLEAESRKSNQVILDNVRDLVPRLLHWGLGEEWSYSHKHIRPYFQHKILMLMIRLNFHMQVDCLTLVQWLQFLREYYQDLLSRPIFRLQSDQDDTLEDSPFLLSLSVEEVHHLPLHHLHRQTVFLFLQCSFSLIGMWLRKSTADFKCHCLRSNTFFAADLNEIKDCCAEKNGLLEFYGWLQEHVPLNNLTEDDVHEDKCIRFASSFIRLYKAEDDMLFEVLLQIFALPLWGERRSSKERMACEDAEDKILSHLSNLFDPVLLFHVFLSELQYDHQLLLDYLISKDTGSKCAEYLLRCMRVVCDSWKLFVEFPFREHVCQKSCLDSCKRRKVFHGDSSGCTRPQYEDAKACLLSLKISLRKFQERKLFPYNPEALIRRYVHLIWPLGMLRLFRSSISKPSTFILFLLMPQSMNSLCIMWYLSNAFCLKFLTVSESRTIAFFPVFIEVIIMQLGILIRNVHLLAPSYRDTRT